MQLLRYRITVSQHGCVRRSIEPRSVERRDTGSIHDHIHELPGGGRGVHKHHSQGNINVRVDVTVPGSELVGTGSRTSIVGTPTSMSPFATHSDAIRRQLEDSRRQRPPGQSARNPAARPGCGAHPADDYGTIETPDGRRVYFHRNSMVDADFDKLPIGAEGA